MVPTDTLLSARANSTKAIVERFLNSAIDGLLQDGLIQEDVSRGPVRWEINSEGDFIARVQEGIRYAATIRRDWLTALPDYAAAAKALTEDDLVGAHLGRAVGTESESFTLNTESLLTTILSDMVSGEGFPGSKSSSFERHWRELMLICESTEFKHVTVMPLPFLRKR